MSNMQTKENPESVRLTINDKEITVPKGTTVYNAAKQLGIEIPIFCYQDRMPPFGACRMCLVEVEKMPKLQTACTLVATEGMVVKTQSAMAIRGREEILEFLLINHPLDCPICDRGGECPLQDQTLKYGPGESRFVEEKRHFKKPIPLGPVLMLDRERCIVCARCTRFGELVAGDHALEFIERGYKTEVGTPDGGPAQSKFIGNTIQICPVGALTSQVYRFRARPWDNKPTQSTCTLCPIGCSMVLDSRDGEIMRTRSYENRDVNDMWLCDKGWFGYEFTSHADRLQQPLVRRSGNLEPASWEEALSLIAAKIKEFQPSGRIAALGGNPLTVEENYLYQKLFREIVGINHLDHRVGMPIIALDDEGIEPGMEITIGECEELSSAVILGCDLTEDFPVIWLRLKQAINRGAKILFIGHFAPEIASHLNQIVVHAPGEELSTLQKHFSQVESLIKSGKKSAIFVGNQYLATTQRKAILSELLKLRRSFSNCSLNLLEGRGNSLGARLTGMRPDLDPFNQRTSKPGFDAMKVLEEAKTSGWDLLYVAGANPAAQFPSTSWNAAKAKLKFLVVQDLFLTETAQQADVVLPTLSFVEKRGTFINIEGRMQKLQPGKNVPEDIYSDAEVFTLLAQKLGKNLIIEANFLTLLKTKAEERKQNLSTLSLNVEIGRAAKNEAHQQKGLLAATFARALFDHGARMLHNSHLVELAKEPCVRLHPQEANQQGIQNGEMVNISANGQTIAAKVKCDERIASGTLVLPLGFPEVPAQNLNPTLLNDFSVVIRSQK